MNIIFALFGINLIWECPFCSNRRCVSCNLFLPSLYIADWSFDVLQLTYYEYFKYLQTSNNGKVVI